MAVIGGFFMFLLSFPVLKADIFISEYSAKHLDSPGEGWMELFNSGLDPVSLDNYYLVVFDPIRPTMVTQNFHRLTGESIPGRSYVILAVDSTTVVTPDIVIPSTSLTFPDIGVVALYEHDGAPPTIIDGSTFATLVDIIAVHQIVGQTAQRQGWYDGIFTTIPRNLVRETETLAEIQDVSLVRCTLDKMDPAAFYHMAASPGQPNGCGSPVLTGSKIVVTPCTAAGRGARNGIKLTTKECIFGDCTSLKVSIETCQLKRRGCINRSPRAGHAGCRGKGKGRSKPTWPRL